MDLKEYKPIALVFYKDGEGNLTALPLEESKLDAFRKAIETAKMIILEGITINTFNIQEIRPDVNLTDLEKYFYSRTVEERAKIKKWMFKRNWNGKTSIIEAIRESLNDPIKRLDHYLNPQEEKEIKEQEEKKEISQEEKEKIKERFQNLKQSFSS